MDIVKKVGRFHRADVAGSWQAGECAGAIGGRARVGVLPRRRRRRRRLLRTGNGR
jgi:hypothetical protein